MSSCKARPCTMKFVNFMWRLIINQLPCFLTVWHQYFGFQVLSCLTMVVDHLFQVSSVHIAQGCLWTSQTSGSTLEMFTVLTKVHSLVFIVASKLRTGVVCVFTYTAVTLCEWLKDYVFYINWNSVVFSWMWRTVWHVYTKQETFSI